MQGNKDNKPWWEPAVELFSQVSTWIVVPILVALFGGKALDAHFGTKPIIFLVAIGLAFLTSCYGIVRVIRDYTKKLKDIDTDSSNK